MQEERWTIKPRAPINELPRVIQENGPDFHWDVKKVWALEVPIEEINIFELEPIFDLPFWYDRVNQCNLCPRKVIESIDSYPDHKKRIFEADLSHPVDIMKNKSGKWFILDGLHRLVKSFIQNDKKVKVRKISRESIPYIKPEV